MPEIDASQVKVALSAIKDRRREYYDLRRADFAERSQRLANRRAIGKVLDSFFTKAGLDVDKLDKMAAQNQSELRQIFQKQRSEIAKHFTSAESTFRREMDSRRKALEHLATLPATPFAPYFVTLDRPVLIVETPHLETDIFIDSHIEALNSWVKIQHQVNSGSRSTEFNFYFIWVNERDDWALVNVTSSLVLTGFCEAVADTGFFSGDVTDLNIQAWLSPFNLPSETDLPEQQSQFQYVASLEARGGAFWDDPDYKPQHFQFTPYDLSYKHFAIEPQGSAAFEVSLRIFYSFSGGTVGEEGGGKLNDLVLIDFANNDSGYSVICPLVQLEVLTAPPNAHLPGKITSSRRKAHPRGTASHESG